MDGARGGEREGGKKRCRGGESQPAETGRSSCDKTRKISLIITEAGGVGQTVGRHLKTQEGRGKTRGHNYTLLAALPSSS